MSRVIQVLKAVAQHEVQRRPWCELAGVTSSFDHADGADSHTVSVQLKDSGVALPRVPVASWATGLAALPRPGDVVLVAFPRGDLASAIVVGQVYSEQRRPPEFTRDELALVWPGDAEDPATDAVDVRIKSNGAGRSLAISLGGDKDAVLTVRDGEIQLQAGGVQIQLSHSSDADGQIAITAGGTRMQLAQDGDLTIESTGQLKLKAASIQIEGDTQVTINGQTVGIN